MAIDPLERYVAHVRMYFEIIWQEINRRQIRQAPNNRVYIVLDAADKLHQLTVDGKPQLTTGKFVNGAKLLMSLWTAPGHRLAKADIKDPEILYKGKSELQNKIGPAVFPAVYQDDTRGGDIWLTDRITVDVLSTSKR